MLAISIRTYQRWVKQIEDQRRGPKTAPANKLSARERSKILEISCSKEFQDKSPWQIVPALADRGEYVASESTFYRVLRAEKMLAHRLPSSPPRNERPKELIATLPNQVWSWDITYLRSNIAGMFFFLYLIIDIYSRKIVGWEVHERESSDMAAHLINRTCIREGVQKNQLFIHSDNGGPMKGATMLATLQRLGVIPSFSRPSVSDDNAFSEALFRTLKYRPYYPRKPFESMEAASLWVEDFVHWYNNEHLHSGIKFVTPNARHNLDDIKILKKREAIYEKAKSKNPARWKGTTRNWDPIACVSLNPLRKEMIEANKHTA